MRRRQILVERQKAAEPAPVASDPPVEIPPKRKPGRPRKVKTDVHVSGDADKDSGRA
jgi:hypothetical protein